MRTALHTLLAAVFAAATIHAQAIIEGAMLGGVAAAAGGSAQKAGQAAGSVFDKTAETLRKAGSAGSRAGAVKRSAVTVPAVANNQVDDSLSSVEPAAVKTGMTRDELVALAGKPWTKITIPGSEGHYTERMTYQLKSGGTLKVILNDGKVSEVQAPDAAKTP